MLIDNQLAMHEESLARDQKDIRSIHKDVNEIVSLIDTISQEVQNQGDMVNNIENKVLNADQEMDEGINKLIAAERNQATGKKAKWILAIVALACVLVVVIVILCCI